MPNKQIQSLTVEGVTYDIVDNTSGYINAQYIENKTDYSIPVSRAGEIIAGETAIGTDSTNFPTSKAVVDYVDERVVQEIEAIDIPTVPTKTSDLTNDSGYLTASDIASVMTYKGTKANYAALPSTGNTTGDVWHLTDTGAEWAWDGSAWQELGTAIDLSGYATKATTLAGYGITDAKIQNGTITLGSNTITPLTSFTETDPTVPSWAKASSKPSYSLTEISGTDDLRAIEALTGTSGLLKKTAANTWTLDTNTYLTSYTETDPIFSASAAAGITSTDISNWNAKPSTDTNTTYTLSNALSSHKFTSTLTAGGSGSGASTATMEFVAGTGITLTDDTTNKKITIASSVVNTDENVKQSRYNLINEDRSILVSSENLDVANETVTTGTYGCSYLVFNNYSQTLKITGSAGQGTLSLISDKITYKKSNYTTSILFANQTANTTITIPNTTGTIALTSDIPTVYSSTNTSGYLTMATLPIYDGTVV